MNESSPSLIAPLVFGEKDTLNGEARRESIQQKNKYINELVENASQVRRLFFEELRKNVGFPPSVDQRMTNLLVCKTAVLLADPWEVCFLLEMLWWEEVINTRDTSLIFLLLKGIEEKGHMEDVSFLEKFHQELGKPERLCYQDGEGRVIPFPGMVRLRQRVKEVISVCRWRGQRRGNMHCY